MGWLQLSTPPAILRVGPGFRSLLSRGEERPLNEIEERLPCTISAQGWLRKQLSEKNKSIGRLSLFGDNFIIINGFCAFSPSFSIGLNASLMRIFFYMRDFFSAKRDAVAIIMVPSG